MCGDTKNKEATKNKEEPIKDMENSVLLPFKLTFTSGSRDRNYHAKKPQPKAVSNGKNPSPSSINGARPKKHDNQSEN